MTDKNQKKQDNGKDRFNSIIAGVTGVVVGAGVAIAGVVALKDEKNRKKVKEALIDVKDQAIDYIEDKKDEKKKKEKEQ